MLKDGIYLVGELVASGPSRYRSGDRAGTPIPNGPSELVLRVELPSGDTRRQYLKFWSNDGDRVDSVAKALTDVDGELQDNGDTRYPRGIRGLFEVGLSHRAYLDPAGTPKSVVEWTAYGMKVVEAPAAASTKK